MSSALERVYRVKLLRPRRKNVLSEGDDGDLD